MFSGFVEVYAGEVVAVGVAVFFEFVGSGLGAKCREHIRLLLDDLLAKIITLLGL